MCVLYKLNKQLFRVSTSGASSDNILNVSLLMMRFSLPAIERQQKYSSNQYLPFRNC